MAKDDVINVLPVDTKAEFKDFLPLGATFLRAPLKVSFMVLPGPRGCP